MRTRTALGVIGIVAAAAAADAQTPEPRVSVPEDLLAVLTLRGKPCGEVVELRVVTSPCRALPSPRHPRPARPACSVREDGVKVVTGESMWLELRAVDRCGNPATRILDPLDPGSEPCAEGVDPETGECCPAIAARGARSDRRP